GAGTSENVLIEILASRGFGTDEDVILDLLTQR
uniref:Calelectrin (Fragments) n=1 Tax=Torpedo marmorata TaxID=7788 RepID=Q7LZ49_TORMA